MVVVAGITSQHLDSGCDSLHLLFEPADVAPQAHVKPTQFKLFLPAAPCAARAFRPRPGAVAAICLQVLGCVSSLPATDCGNRAGIWMPGMPWQSCTLAVPYRSRHPVRPSRSQKPFCQAEVRRGVAQCCSLNRTALNDAAASKSSKCTWKPQRRSP